MRKGSKKPEDRWQELVDIATRLFLEKGYEAVSVKDILTEVQGAQGMFYHYFSSKQDIYLEAMNQYLNNTLADKISVLSDTSLSFVDKSQKFREVIKQNYTVFKECFDPGSDSSVDSDAHRARLFIEMINKLHEPYTTFIIQGIREEVIKENITFENASRYALFALYGAFGLMHHPLLTGNTRSNDEFEVSIANAFEIVPSIFRD